MALDVMYTVNTAYVNTSSQNIKVFSTLGSWAGVGYETAAGKRIGTIYPGEFYIVLGAEKNNRYDTWAKIRFNDGTGVREGYIETYSDPPLTSGRRELSWVSEQEPYHYYKSNGTRLVSNKRQTCGDKNLYVFELSYDSTYKNSSGTSVGTLKAGSLIGISDSTVGERYKDYICVSRIKPRGTGTWKKIESGSYGWVDMNIKKGSEPSNRNLI